MEVFRRGVSDGVQVLDAVLQVVDVLVIQDVTEQQLFLRFSDEAVHGDGGELGRSQIGAKDRSHGNVSVRGCEERALGVSGRNKHRLLFTSTIVCTKPIFRVLGDVRTFTSFEDVHGSESDELGELQSDELTEEVLFACV